MHFRRALAVGVALASFTIVATAPASVTPRVILDSFNRPTIDQDVWAFWGTDHPANVTFTQTGEALRTSVSGDASGFNAGGATRCRAHGDFDARLTFNLVEWPAENGVTVSLNTADTGGFNVYRVSWQFSNAPEAYGAFFPPSGGGAVPATGTSGTLRLTRTGSTWAAYYLNESDVWVSLGSGEGPTYDIQFIPSLFNLSNVLPFSGQTTTVDFDKFKVLADSIVCP